MREVHQSEPVRCWEHEIVISTYPVQDADPNPMFLEKRVYQHGVVMQILSQCPLAPAVLESGARLTCAFVCDSYRGRTRYKCRIWDNGKFLPWAGYCRKAGL